MNTHIVNSYLFFKKNLRKVMSGNCNNLRSVMLDGSQKTGSTVSYRWKAR